jgi:hypothetical protein
MNRLKEALRFMFFGEIPESLQSRPTREFRYGDDKTIHQTEYIDIGVDENGKVQEVWFRCMQLPFNQFKARDYKYTPNKELKGIKAIVFDNWYENENLSKE